MTERFFASDNSSPVHPDVIAAVQAANSSHAISYGDDRWTQAATAALGKLLGRKSSVHFVYNGTGANVLGMQAGLSSYQAVICTDCSHVNVDECGAVENFTGAKLIPLHAPDGRLRAEQVLAELHAIGVEHHSQPRIVSLTQSTELGTVYPKELVREIARVCHRNDLLLHMDGARISNAAVSLDADIASITGKLGVDILSLGGTKNGMMFGEAVVFFRPELADAFKYVRKQGMQLASKMRYIAAQFSALFGTDLWWRLASHANEMARHLARELADVSEVAIVHPVEANAVFAQLPQRIISRVQDEIFFYVWEPKESIVRLMCSFDTTKEDVTILLSAIDRALDR